MELPSHIEICVTSGGYIVKSVVKMDGELDYNTSVFTDVLTLCSYIRSTVVGLEGPDEELTSGDRIGGLKIE